MAAAKLTIGTKPVQDLAGKLFGRLTVISFSGRHANGKTMWLCRCECGKEVAVVSGSLKSGNTKSCGCFNDQAVADRSRTHGMSRTSEYNSWAHLISRCENKNNARYADYGGRGIKACSRWRESFENFLADMGEKPSPKRDYTIERENNDGNYEPGNCIWVLRDAQARNTRKNVRIVVAGKSICLSELAQQCGVRYSSVEFQSRKGMTGDQIVAHYASGKSRKDQKRWMGISPRVQKVS